MLEEGSIVLEEGSILALDSIQLLEHKALGSMGCYRSIRSL
jgi:hypothetical protein